MSMETENLIEATRTERGLEAIEQYTNSNSETPPDLSKIKKVGEGPQDEELECVSSQDLSRLVKNTDQLDYGEIKTAEQILVQPTC